MSDAGWCSDYGPAVAGVLWHLYPVRDGHDSCMSALYIRRGGIIPIKRWPACHGHGCHEFVDTQIDR